MRLFRLLIIAAIIVATILLGGCQVQETTSSPTNPTTAHEDGYPLTTDALNESSGYPLVEEYQPIAIPEVTPNATTGVVKGRVTYQGEPVVGYNLYLADIVVDDQGIETTAILKRSSAPQAILGISGEFIFYEIQPDRYVLMLYNGTSAFLLLKPNQTVEEAITLDVVAGETIDLGTLEYQDLPIN